MPPQPLTSVRLNAKPTADPGSLSRYPLLAAHVGEAIAIWSRIESTLGIILALMLKAGVRASVAMYAAILNSKAQMDALEAAARVTLNPEDFELFGAVILLIKRTGAKRHKLAHWLWGYSDDLPNALLLYDPDYVLEFSTATSEFIRALLSGDFSAQRTPLDKSKIFVYRERDLLEIVAELRNADAISLKFATLVFEPDAPGAGALRIQLSNEPQIQEALTRIRAQSRSAP